ncbi:hypothetical protein AKJ16_DCAP15596, partial [Drosera capensis]
SQTLILTPETVAYATINQDIQSLLKSTTLAPFCRASVSPIALAIRPINIPCPSLFLPRRRKSQTTSYSPPRPDSVSPTTATPPPPPPLRPKSHIYGLVERDQLHPRLCFRASYPHD